MASPPRGTPLGSEQECALTRASAWMDRDAYGPISVECPGRQTCRGTNSSSGCQVLGGMKELGGKQPRGIGFFGDN